MKPAVTIRRAVATDLPSIYDGELDYIRQIEPQQEADWRSGMRFHLQQWTSNLTRMFIAERDGTFTGYCFWEIHEADAVLASIYVLFDERGRGLGRLLLAAYVADGQSKGFRRFTLGVTPANPACLLYETAGFSHTHDDRGYRHYLKKIEI
jgi:ribosomal protein S18 acetylase RimI-like enzyme